MEGEALNACKPLVCVPASHVEIRPEGYRVHATGSNCVESVERFSVCVPIILPALADRIDLESFAARIDGLLLTGGRANIEPYHYGGDPFPDDEFIDPGRDNTVLPLVRACVEAEVPVFGICRGIQELNVALGGTLHYRVHQVPGMDDHRMPQREDVTAEQIFEPRHPVHLARGGTFEGLVGRCEVKVNSLHGQGIDRLAECLEVEARSPDGIIEGVRPPRRRHLHGGSAVARGVEARGTRPVSCALPGVRCRRPDPCAASFRGRPVVRGHRGGVKAGRRPLPL